MRMTVRMAAVALIGAGLVFAGVGTALSADELCAMGGTMIKVEVKKDKALDWGKDQRKAKVSGEDTDTWTVLALSDFNRDIAVLIAPEYVFFGIAGKADREVSERDVEKVFGKDFKILREVVKKSMGELWKANIVKIEGSDVQKLSDAVGLGTLEKDNRDWELKTDSCTGMELDTSDL